MKSGANTGSRTGLSVIYYKEKKTIKEIESTVIKSKPGVAVQTVCTIFTFSYRYLALFS